MSRPREWSRGSVIQAHIPRFTPPIGSYHNSVAISLEEKGLAWCVPDCC
ncbi:hypothetical protein BAY1663_02203 [Pseudomonas sp. BAY1663]|nr:hypothetical protein BAY1663_02203 [Pseudomonas sp. BAY1663]